LQADFGISNIGRIRRSNGLVLIDSLCENYLDKELSLDLTPITRPTIHRSFSFPSEVVEALSLIEVLPILSRINPLYDIWTVFGNHGIKIEQKIGNHDDLWTQKNHSSSHPLPKLEPNWMMFAVRWGEVLSALLGIIFELLPIFSF
jgi:hypothetical protein